MIKDIIAKRYAKALLSLAEQTGKTAEVKSDLVTVSEVYGVSKSMQSVFMNPAFTQANKSKALAAVIAEYKVTSLTARFLETLLDKRRFTIVREVSTQYSDLLDVKEGRVKATVTAAAALDDVSVGKMRAKLHDMFAKEIELKVEVDPALIAGVRARVGGTVYDGSLSNQITRIRETLLRD